MEPAFCLYRTYYLRSYSISHSLFSGFYEPNRSWFSTFAVSWTTVSGTFLIFYYRLEYCALHVRWNFTTWCEVFKRSQTQFISIILPQSLLITSQFCDACSHFLFSCGARWRYDTVNPFVSSDSWNHTNGQTVLLQCYLLFVFQEHSGPKFITISVIFTSYNDVTDSIVVIIAGVRPSNPSFSIIFMFINDTTVFLLIGTLAMVCKSIKWAWSVLSIVYTVGQFMCIHRSRDQISMQFVGAIVEHEITQFMPS